MGQHSSVSASRLLGLDGFEVLAAEVAAGEWQLVVPTTAELVGCAGCGVRAEAHGRRTARVRDLPAGGRPVALLWRKRIWRCGEPTCGVGTWTERAAAIRPRAVLTERARAEACRRVGRDAHAVAAVARDLGVGWQTVMRAVRDHGGPLVDDPQRLAGVAALGLDETSFLKATRVAPTRWADSVGVAELSRLTRTVRAWEAEFLAFHTTGGCSNGPTEAVNLLTGKVKRVGHGFRNFANYRLRLLLHCGVTWPDSPDRQTAKPPSTFRGRPAQTRWPKAPRRTLAREILAEVRRRSVWIKARLPDRHRRPSRLGADPLVGAPPDHARVVGVAGGRVLDPFLRLLQQRPGLGLRVVGRGAGLAGQRRGPRLDLLLGRLGVGHRAVSSVRGGRVGRQLTAPARLHGPFRPLRWRPEGRAGRLCSPRPGRTRS